MNPDPCYHTVSLGSLKIGHSCGKDLIVLRYGRIEDWHLDTATLGRLATFTRVNVIDLKRIQEKVPSG